MKKLVSLIRPGYLDKEKKVIENFFSLSSIQIVNYILPLITFPYLLRVIGVEKFGLLAFAQTIISYFLVLIDYSFIFTATRDVSLNRNDKEKLSAIFSAVMVIKLFFLIICFLIFLFLLAFVYNIRNNSMVYFFSIGLILDSILFPVWFFQGIEDMKIIANRNLLIKATFTLLIFIFVKTKNDYLAVPLINTIGYLIAGVVSMYYLINKFHLEFNCPSKFQIYTVLAGGVNIFMIKLFISILMFSPVLFLGIQTNNTLVGYYTAGEKLIAAVVWVCSPLFQAIFPYIVKMAADSKKDAISKIKRLLKISSYIFGVLFICFFSFANEIGGFVLGLSCHYSFLTIRILSPVIIVMPISYILANLTFVPFKLDRDLLKIYFAGALFNLFLAFFLIVFFKMEVLGAALTTLFTQLFIASFLGIILIRKKILAV